MKDKNIKLIIELIDIETDLRETGEKKLFKRLVRLREKLEGVLK